MLKDILKQIEEDFIEKGAELEHDRWTRWQKYMFSKMQYSEYKDGEKTMACYILPADLWERWNRQIDTPYSELSEQEKESDRKETRNYLPLIKSSNNKILSAVERDVEKVKFCRCNRICYGGCEDLKREVLKIISDANK